MAFPPERTPRLPYERSALEPIQLTVSMFLGAADEAAAPAGPYTDPRDNYKIQLPEGERQCFISKLKQSWMAKLACKLVRRHACNESIIG